MIIENETGKEVIIISDFSAGMCIKTRGMTLVVFKYKNDARDFPLVMEQKEFYKKHSKK